MLLSGPFSAEPEPRALFSTGQVCNMTGASYRRVDYWRRLGIIPGLSPDGPGSGGHVWWNAEQVEFVRRLLLVLPPQHEHILRKAAEAVERGICPTCEQALPEAQP